MQSLLRLQASVRESLGRLQLSYVDLIQTHDIEFATMNQVCIHGRRVAMVAALPCCVPVIPYPDIVGGASAALLIGEQPTPAVRG